ncbi:MAG: alpha/beta hydrolase fold domain-containing protein [Akkermansiaceae bacterium]
MFKVALPIFFMSLLAGSQCFAQAGAPQRNIKYDTKHERNVLDFWPAKKDDAPVFIFFHGGGFRGGDKGHIERNRGASIESYRKAGFAIVSCNYPFLSSEMDYEKIAHHCARSVQFVRSKAKDWKIDPERICCGGISAGALISEFLGYHDDFADPKSEDAVTRESSRAQVVVSIMQPIGTKDFALRFMEKGEAPLFIYSTASPDDFLHPPAQAKLIHEKAKSLKIPTVMYGNARNGLPEIPKGKNWLDLKIAFCLKHLPK